MGLERPQVGHHRWRTLCALAQTPHRLSLQAQREAHGVFFHSRDSHARNDQDGSVRRLALEHKGLCNLLDLTADGLSRFLCGSRRAGQLHDLAGHP